MSLSRQKQTFSRGLSVQAPRSCTVPALSQCHPCVVEAGAQGPACSSTPFPHRPGAIPALSPHRPSPHTVPVPSPSPHCLRTVPALQKLAPRGLGAGWPMDNSHPNPWGNHKLDCPSLERTPETWRAAWSLPSLSPSNSPLPGSAQPVEGREGYAAPSPALSSN